MWRGDKHTSQCWLWAAWRDRGHGWGGVAGMGAGGYADWPTRTSVPPCPQDAAWPWPGPRIRIPSATGSRPAHRPPLPHRVPGGYSCERAISSKAVIAPEFLLTAVGPPIEEEDSESGSVRSGKQRWHHAEVETIVTADPEALETATRARLDAIERLKDVLTEEEKSSMRRRVLRTLEGLAPDRDHHS